MNKEEKDRLKELYNNLTIDAAISLLRDAKEIDGAKVITLDIQYPVSIK